MSLRLPSVGQTETIYLHLEDSNKMPTPFPTLTEMEKFAQKNNLQSLTSEFGDVENQDAIDAAQGYNKSEQERVSKNFYDAGMLNKYRELNSKKLDERNAVINMQRSLRGNAGVGSTVTDTGFAQTTMGSDYMPEFVPREAPKFQNLPKPEFQKATISRFNPNAGSGDKTPKAGKVRFKTLNGKPLPGRNEFGFGQVLSQATGQEYDGYAGYQQYVTGLQDTNSFNKINGADFVAEVYDIANPLTGINYTTGSILSLGTVGFKYSQDIATQALGKNGENFLTANGKSDFPDDKPVIKLLYELWDLNGGKAQLQPGSVTSGGKRLIDVDDLPGNKNIAFLGDAFSAPIDNTGKTVNSMMSYKIKTDATTGNSKIVYTQRPEIVKAAKAVSLSYQIAFYEKKQDQKMINQLAKSNDIGEELDWTLAEVYKHASDVMAAEYVAAATPQISPDVENAILKKHAAGELDGNTWYGLGDTEDYGEMGWLPYAGILSSNKLTKPSGSSFRSTFSKRIRGSDLLN